MTSFSSLAPDFILYASFAMGSFSAGWLASEGSAHRKDIQEIHNGHVRVRYGDSEWLCETCQPVQCEIMSITFEHEQNHVTPAGELDTPYCCCTQKISNLEMLLKTDIKLQRSPRNKLPGWLDMTLASVGSYLLAFTWKHTKNLLTSLGGVLTVLFREFVHCLEAVLDAAREVFTRAPAPAPGDTEPETPVLPNTQYSFPAAPEELDYTWIRETEKNISEIPLAEVIKIGEAVASNSHYAWYQNG